MVLCIVGCRYELCCRGETFRSCLLQIGKIWSIIPDGVNIMALTATTTNSLLLSVVRILGMWTPVIVANLPGMPNLRYSVLSYSPYLKSKPILL